MLQESRLMKEGAILGILYLILLFVSLFIPILNIVMIFLLPIPFIIFTTRYGWKASSVLFLVVFIVGAVFAMFITVPIMVLTGITGIMIGSAIHNNSSPYETWARASLGFLLGIMFIFVYVQGVLNINIMDEFYLAIDDSIEMTQDTLGQFGLESGSDQIELIRQQMEYMLNLLPVMFVVISIFCGFVIQWIGYKALNRFDHRSLRFPPFRNFQLPKVLIWIYFIAILFSWFDLDPNSGIYLTVINITNLAGLIISLQGFSFILYYTYKKGLSKVIPIISFIIIVLFPPIGLYMIRILGIIDLGFSLRDRIADGNK